MTQRLARIGLIGVLTLVLGVLLLNRYHSRFGHSGLLLTFFDVGQGDSALVQFPGGRTLLIDAGGGNRFWNRGEKQLFLALARRAILKIDTALVSHPDQDHALGFLGLMRHVEFGEIWGRRGWEKPLWRAVRGDAENRKIPVVEISSERRWESAGVSARVLPGTGKTVNDAGLILELEYAGCRVLFTGDISRRVEEGNHGWFRDVDILKVAHHGSGSSSTEKFLERVRPEWAVISAGERNRYGHPHPRTLRRLLRSGSQTLRTDFHHEIEFEIFADGEIQCRSELGPCGRIQCPLPLAE